MNFTVFNKLSGAGKLFMEKTRQARPEIGLILGIISVASGTVIACTKTKEAVDTIETTKIELNDVKENTEEGSREALIEYSRVYGRFLYKMIKVYGISILLWAGGMGSIIGSHADLKKQNTNLILDSMAFKKLFDEYRRRVANEIGKEQEEKLYFDLGEDEVEVLEMNPVTGTKKITRKKADVFKSQSGSKFARNFSERTSYEFDVRSYADFFLEERIKRLNMRLKAVPFITINEVYDELGMKPEYGRCEDGLDWGWVWNPSNPDGPNEIIIERLKGWEEVYDDRENRSYYVPCLRIDFNCMPLRGLI